MGRFLPLLFACSALTGCLVRPETRPRLTSEAAIASKFMHRGMVQNENEVVQLDGRVDLETKLGGDLSAEVFGNIDLHDDTGDAWFPDGHGGKFTSVEMQLWYTHRFGRLFVSGGIAPYLLPNGTEFIATPAGSERGETKELFVNAETEIARFVPSFTIHYDFDEAEGFYVETGVMRGFPINSKLRAEATLRGAYSDEDHSLWTYGLDESGLADVGLAGSIFYLFDKSTEIRLTLASSTIVDSGLDEWFDLIGIESDNLWASIGIVWTY